MYGLNETFLSHPYSPFFPLSQPLPENVVKI